MVVDSKFSDLEIAELSSILDYQVTRQNNSNFISSLIQADNLIALKYLLTERNLVGKVDLIYIDPPFSTNTTFRFSENRANSVSAALTGSIAYSDQLKGADYLDFLRKRLVLLKALLSEQGSIYLHIDYKIGHYVKVLMDEIFGIENFRNDITRIKCNPKNFKRKAYGNIKDMILFYSKSKSMIWNEPIVPYSNNERKNLFAKTDDAGRSYTTAPLHAPGESLQANAFKGICPPPGRHWSTDIKTLEAWDQEGLLEWSSQGNPRKKIYSDQKTGKRMQDIWEFKDPQYPSYPTEKNRTLLNLIISTSSNPGSLVLDCFAGSGTTAVSAAELKRSWIAIDESEQAIKILKAKFSKLKTAQYQDLMLSPKDNILSI